MPKSLTSLSRYAPTDAAAAQAGTGAPVVLQGVAAWTETEAQGSVPRATLDLLTASSSGTLTGDRLTAGAILRAVFSDGSVTCWRIEGVRHGLVSSAGAVSLGSQDGITAECLPLWYDLATDPVSQAVELRSSFLGTTDYVADRRLGYVRAGSALATVVADLFSAATGADTARYAAGTSGSTTIARLDNEDQLVSVNVPAGASRLDAVNAVADALGYEYQVTLQATGGNAGKYEVVVQEQNGSTLAGTAVDGTGMAGEGSGAATVYRTLSYEGGEDRTGYASALVPVTAEGYNAAGARWPVTAVTDEAGLSTVTLGPVGGAYPAVRSSAIQALLTPSDAAGQPVGLGYEIASLNVVGTEAPYTVQAVIIGTTLAASDAFASGWATLREVNPDEAPAPTPTSHTPQAGFGPLLHVEDPDASGAGSRGTARVLYESTVPPFRNAAADGMDALDSETEIGAATTVPVGTSTLDGTITANTPAGWSQIDPDTLGTIVVTADTDKFHYGTARAKAVLPTAGQGLETIAFVPRHERAQAGPYVSARLHARCTRGSVRVTLVDSQGGVYPPRPNEAQADIVAPSVDAAGDGSGAADETLVPNFGDALEGVEIAGAKIAEGGTAAVGTTGGPATVRVRVVALEDDTTVYLDALTVAASVNAYPYAARMGPEALFADAAAQIARTGTGLSATATADVIDQDAELQVGDRVAVIADNGMGTDAAGVSLSGDTLRIAQTVTRYVPGSGLVTRRVLFDRPPAELPRLGVTSTPSESTAPIVVDGGAQPKTFRTFDPYEFGAIGNGIADDTAAVQAALDAAADAASYVSDAIADTETQRHLVAPIVTIPPGRFRITRTLDAPFVSVYAEGWIVAGADGLLCVNYPSIDRFAKSDGTEQGVFGLRSVHLGWRIDGEDRPGVGIRVDNMSRYVVFDTMVVNFRGEVSASLTGTVTGTALTLDAAPTTVLPNGSGIKVGAGADADPDPYVILDLAAGDPGNGTVYTLDRPSQWQRVNVEGITQANPGVVTATGHEFESGQQVLLSSIGGMTEVEGNVYTVANVVAGVSFELSGTDTTAFTAFTGGGIARRDVSAVSQTVTSLSTAVALTHVNQCKVRGLYQGSDIGLAITKSSAALSNGFVFEQPIVTKNDYSLYLSQVNEAGGRVIATNSDIARDVTALLCNRLDLWCYLENSAHNSWKVDNPGLPAGDSPFLERGLIRDLYGRGNSWRCLWSALADFSWLIENYSIQTTFIADAPQLIQHPTTGLYAFARMPEATGSFRWIEVIGSTAEDNPKKWVVFQQDQQTYFKRGVRGSITRFDDYSRTGTMTWLAEEGLAEGNSGLNGIDVMRVQVEGEDHERLTITQRGE
ncbi:MAG: ubiquitin-activating E1 FCCH domain-containing protein, partial [Bacteroidota bacterium]